MPQWSQVFRHRHDRGLGKQCLQYQIRLRKQSVCRTVRPGQTTVNSRSSLIRVYTICHSVCIFWMHYSMVKSSLKFRMYSNSFFFFFGAQMFLTFTVPYMKHLTLWYLSFAYTSHANLTIRPVPKFILAFNIIYY